jgi:hypothetical protein
LRILHLWAIALSLACLIQAPASAQRAESPERPSLIPECPLSYLPGLIFNKKVQEELGLDSKQIEGVGAASRKVKEKYKDEFAKAVKNIPDQGDGAVFALYVKMDKENMKAFGDVLKPEQMKRLKQIQFQKRLEEWLQGALLEPDVAKELQWTDKQRGDGRDPEVPQ